MIRASYRSMTKKENKGKAPPVLSLPKEETATSIAGEKHYGIPYVILRGGKSDIYIREDILRRVP